MMGACALLSHDYSGRPGTAMEPEIPRKSRRFHPAGIRFSLS